MKEVLVAIILKTPPLGLVIVFLFLFLNLIFFFFFLIEEFPIKRISRTSAANVTGNKVQKEINLSVTYKSSRVHFVNS